MNGHEELGFVKSVTTFITGNIDLSKRLVAHVNRSNDSEILTSEEISRVTHDGILVEHNGSLQFPSIISKNLFTAFQEIHQVGVDNFLQGERLVRVGREHIIILNRVYSVDFNLIVASATKEKFWSIYYSYCKALMLLETNTQDFCKALHNILRLTENDMLGGEIYGSLSELGKLQPQSAEKIAADILSSSDPKLLSFIPALYQGLSYSVGADDIFNRAASLAADSDPEYQKIGILSLALIHYESSPNKHVLLINTENILSKLDIQNISILPAIAQSYSNLIDKVPTARERLAEISKTDDPQTLYSISILLNKIKIEDDWQWCEQILYELAKVKPEHKGILDRIVFWLDDRTVDHSDLILNFFERWMMYDHNLPQDIEKFKHLFSKIMATNKAFLWTLVTKWLIDERLKFQMSLAEILREFYVSGVKEILLDRSIVSGLSFDEVKILVFRILGFVINKEHLQSMVYSVLEFTPQSKEVQQLIISAYVQYIVYNYPGTIEFLKGKEANANPYEKKAIAGICKSWNRYIRQLRKLPRLNELKASDERQIAHMKMQSKIFSKGFHKSQEGSLLNLFRHIDLKGGEYMFHRTKDGYSQKSKLGVIEAGGELPRGEFIDPVGQARLRFFWKTMQRK